jgi:hypothetical protein
MVDEQHDPPPGDETPAGADEQKPEPDAAGADQEKDAGGE